MLMTSSAVHSNNFTAGKGELEEFHRRRVYDIVPRSSIGKGAKIVGVRRVDTDKGGVEGSKIRSRLVA